MNENEKQISAEQTKIKNHWTLNRISNITKQQNRIPGTNTIKIITHACNKTLFKLK